MVPSLDSAARVTSKKSSSSRKSTKDRLMSKSFPALLANVPILVFAGNTGAKDFASFEKIPLEVKCGAPCEFTFHPDPVGRSDPVSRIFRRKVHATQAYPERAILPKLPILKLMK